VSGSIVCGVDGSKSAAGAIRFARTVSEWLGLRLVPVNVTELPVVPGAAAIPHACDEFRASAVDAASELLDAMCRTQGLCEGVERRVELGNPAERLMAVSDEEGAELLVVGARGRGSLPSAALGSVSASVAERAACPVALVPERAADSTLGAEWDEARLPKHAHSSPSKVRLGDGGRA
jgi:nucleotide-binding universal stress UspA family protein